MPNPRTQQPPHRSQPPRDRTVTLPPQSVVGYGRRLAGAQGSRPPAASMLNPSSYWPPSPRPAAPPRLRSFYVRAAGATRARGLALTVAQLLITAQAILAVVSAINVIKGALVVGRTTIPTGASNSFSDGFFTDGVATAALAAVVFVFSFLAGRLRWRVALWILAAGEFVGALFALLMLEGGSELSASFFQHPNFFAIMESLTGLMFLRPQISLLIATVALAGLLWEARRSRKSREDV